MAAAITFSFIFSLPIVLVSIWSLNAVYYAVLYLGLLCGIVFMLNRRLLFLMLPLSLFVNSGIFFYSLSEWIVLCIAIVVAFTSPQSLWSLRPDLGRAVTIYVFAIILSFLNVSDWSWSLLQLGHMVTLVCAMVVFSSSTDSVVIRRLLVFFVLCGLANSMHVFYQAATTNERVFGFAGIMFVDYAGLGIVICLFMAIFGRGLRRGMWAAAAVVLLVGLLTTQTRNPVISLVLASTVTIGALLLCNEHFSRQRRLRLLRNVAIAFGLCALAGTYFVVHNKVLVSRVEQLDIAKVQVRTVADVASSSLVSRILIWDTAINAFKAHPLVGMGAYSFPVASKKYATIHPELHRRYVKNLSPHLGYLMVLCETGIIGFTAFMFLIVTLVKNALCFLRKSREGAELQTSVVIAGMTFYLVFSLWVTDAWFYHSGAVLFGMIAGMVGAQANMMDCAQGTLSSASQG